MGRVSRVACRARMMPPYLSATRSRFEGFLQQSSEGTTGVSISAEKAALPRVSRLARLHGAAQASVGVAPRNPESVPGVGAVVSPLQGTVADYLSGMARDLVASGAGIAALQVAGRWASVQVPAHYARAELAAKVVKQKAGRLAQSEESRSVEGEPEAQWDESWVTSLEQVFAGPT